MKDPCRAGLKYHVSYEAEAASLGLVSVGAPLAYENGCQILGPVIETTQKVGFF